MDSLITAAARALAAGNPLAALDRVALRDDPPALALRGTAMAQLGDFSRASQLLERAVRAFGPNEAVARARAIVALAEVALATREAPPRGVPLEQAIKVLKARGDEDNALYGRLVAIRRDLVFGRVSQAETALDALGGTEGSPRRIAFLELTRAQLALRRARGSQARGALLKARSAAQRAHIGLLVSEVNSALQSLDVPAARCMAGGVERAIAIEQVEHILSSNDVVIDACSRCISYGPVRLRLARRPVLFALARQLGTCWPGAALREDLIFAAFDVKRANDSHRARLRVDMGRLRRALRGVAEVSATEQGYRLVVPASSETLVLLPPIDGDDAQLLALLADGECWSTSMLALAAHASQRSVQRALSALETEGRVRSVGRGRTQRWVAPVAAGFTTVLLLASLASGD